MLRLGAVADPRSVLSRPRENLNKTRTRAHYRLFAPAVRHLEQFYFRMKPAKKQDPAPDSGRQQSLR